MSACARTVQQPWGTVRLERAVWTGQETRLAATVAITTPDSGPVAARRRRPHMHGMVHGGPPSLTLVDEHGRKHDGYFSGGGSDTGWTGTFTFAPGLATNASWFSLYCERIEFAPNPDDVTMRVVSNPPDVTAVALAEQYLAFCVESTSRHSPDAADRVEIAIDTLVATGVLTADTP